MEKWVFDRLGHGQIMADRNQHGVNVVISK